METNYRSRTLQVIKEAFTRAGHPELVGMVQVEWSNKMYRCAGWALWQPPVSRGTIKLSIKHAESLDFSVFQDTILHECGHILAWYKHGTRIKGHGQEWKAACRLCGLNNPKARYNQEDKETFKVWSEHRRKNLKTREIMFCSCPGKEYKLHPNKAKQNGWYCKTCKTILQKTGKVIQFY